MGKGLTVSTILHTWQRRSKRLLRGAVWPRTPRLRDALFLLVFLLPLWGQPGAAAEGTSWFTPVALSEGWEAVRSGLVEQGVTPSFTYTTDLLGNPVGGQKQRFRQAGALSATLTFDLNTLLKLKDLQFILSGEWRSGQNLGGDIGSVIPPAQIFGGDTVRLYQLALKQSLFDERVSIMVGRIGLGDDFLTAPIYSAFVSTAFNGNPGSIPTNFPGFSSQPVAAWGARVLVQPVESFYVMAGVSDSNPRLGRNAAHGVNFRFGNGAFAVVELGYLLNQGKDATGLPGTYKLGGYYDSSRFPDLNGPPDAEVRGNAGVYLHAEQMVYREEGAKEPQGLTPFVALTVSPSQRRNILPFFVMGGLVYQGLVPGRDSDTTAFGAAYGLFSDALAQTSYELVLEWTHAFVLTSALTVQPDIQYILRPGGSSSVPNALVLGVQIAMKL